MNGKYPILRYFAYQHLPPHLQAVSRPFAELADAIASSPMLVPRHVFVALRATLNDLLVVDREEMQCAHKKLNQCWVEMFEDEEAHDSLRLLLEAKDCAVRAMLPLPATTDTE